jgi:pyruvate kinase
MLPYLRKAAAVISEEGSTDSHTATVGLTLDLPVIVGAGGAARRLQDGLMVSVDCVHGMVQTLPQ